MRSIEYSKNELIAANGTRKPENDPIEQIKVDVCFEKQLPVRPISIQTIYILARSGVRRWR
jgi:hypothetical protein